MDDPTPGYTDLVLHIVRSEMLDSLLFFCYMDTVGPCECDSFVLLQGQQVWDMTVFMAPLRADVFPAAH